MQIYSFELILIAGIIASLFMVGACSSKTEWLILPGEVHRQDEAFRVCRADLQATGSTLEHGFELIEKRPESAANIIFVGDAARNLAVAELVQAPRFHPAALGSPEGYQIASGETENGRFVIVSGGSLSGDIYGLYRVLDRLKVCGEIPALNEVRTPSLQIRFTRIIVRTKEDICRALRYGLNHVYIETPLALTPWNAEPERSENEANRRAAHEIIQYAHQLRLKVLAFGTEFTYHPSILKEFDATLSPSDPSFWDALQAKYRRLLQALPELDGVATFTGPEQDFWGNYRTFDIMHDQTLCDWTLEKRYRTFIKKMHHVVVGEFDKIYHHHTWTTNCYEQQARPEVYQAIFTADVPVKNLFLFPSFTQNDRWWHQRYNPTFNLTPHQMLTVLEPMNYYEASKSNIFPTYPGPYYQAGLQMVLEDEKCNLRGASFDLYPAEDFRTAALTAYTAYRLGWNHLEDPRQIAEDFCAIHFGQAAARQMAEIYLLSPVAYKYGLFIEPVAYGHFNSLPHIRVGTFPAMGYSAIDGGREHIDFWRKIYLSCKPWIDETYDDLDHGLEVTECMLEQFKTAKPLIRDQTLAKDVEISLNVTRHLVRTNNLYVKSAFDYFAYLDAPSSATKKHLAARHAEFKAARDAFASAPGFGYHLFGVDQVLLNIEDALLDVEQARLRLRQAPTSQQIEQTIASQQTRYVQVLQEQRRHAVKFLHWEGLVDGRDLLEICGENVRIIHLRWDPPSVTACQFFKPLPKKAVTVIVDDIQSRPIHPFVLDQPSPENDFTAKVYLYDEPEGRDWIKFDLYYIEKSPAGLDLKRPW